MAAAILQYKIKSWKKKSRPVLSEFSKFSNVKVIFRAAFTLRIPDCSLYLKVGDFLFFPCLLISVFKNIF